MGEVWRVYDAGLDRTLAMKVLREELASQSSFVTRFVREAQLTAGLAHRGIAPVHALGRLGDGRPYYTMKELAGRTLGEVIASASSDVLEMLSWLAEVAEALAYAHEKGVLHRDVKPENILIGSFGEVTLLDWGLARRDADATEAPAWSREGSPQGGTRVGAVIGTPGFMAPEQARGEPVGPAADVYALGLTLRAIVRGEAVPVVPSDPGSGLPGALADLARGALEPDPAQRLPNAAVFRDGLHAWLDGARSRERAEALAARVDDLLESWPDGDVRVAMEVLIRLADPDGRARPVPREAIDHLHPRATALVTLLSGAGVLVSQSDAVGWSDQALPSYWPRLRAALAAEGPGLVLRDRLATAAADWDVAGRTPDLMWHGSQLALAVAWRRSAAPVLSPTEVAFLDAGEVEGRRAQRRQRLWIQGSFVSLLVATTTLAVLWLDARRAWTQERVALTASEARGLLARGFEAEQLRHPHEAVAYYLAAAELGAEGARAAAEQVAAVGVRSWVVPVSPGGAWRALFSADEHALFVGAADGLVREIDVSDGVTRRTFGPHGLDVLDMVLRPDRLLVWGLFPGPWEWDVRTGETIVRHDLAARAGRGMTELDSGLFVATDVGGGLSVWSATSGEELGRVHLPARGFRYAAAGGLLGLEDGDGVGYVFTLPDLKPVWSQAGVGRCGVASAGVDLIFFGKDGSTLRFFGGETGPARVTPGHLAGIDAVHDVWQRGPWIVVGQPGGDVGLLNPETMSLTTLVGHSGNLADAAVVSIGLLATVADEEAIIWDPVNASPRVFLHGHHGPVKVARWSADGRRVATASLDGTARIWDVSWLADGEIWTEAGAPVVDMTLAEDGSGWAWCVASGACFATDGREQWPLPSGVQLAEMLDGVVFSSSERTFRLDHAGGAILEVEQPLQPPWVTEVGMAVNPPRITALAMDGSLDYWALGADGVEHRRFSTRSGVNNAEIDLTVDRMVSVTSGSASLWEPSTGREVAVLPADITVTFAPDQLQVLGPSGEVAAVRSFGGARRFAIDDGRELPAPDGLGRLVNVKLARNGQTLAAPGYNRTVVFYSLPAGVELFRAGPFPGLPNESAFSPDGRWFAVYDDQGDVRVWDVQARRLFRHVQAGKGVGRKVGFRGDGRLVAGFPGHWRTWSLAEDPPAPEMLTNFRVCRDGGDVVPVVPFPTSESPWAPEAACPRK